MNSLNGLAFTLLLTTFIIGCAGSIPQKQLNDDIRSSIPDRNFVKLPGGITSYQWAGPKNGKKIVLVHGLTSPSFIWESQFHGLADAGYRVLRYDLYGRGYSDRPNREYTRKLYRKQLFNLLNVLGISKSIHLAGLSMGGGIAVDFTRHYPEKIDKLALIAPAGTHSQMPLSYYLATTPYLGDITVQLFGDWLILRSIGDSAAPDNPRKQKKLESVYREQMQFSGYKRSILSSLRHGPVTNLKKVYKAVGKQDREILLIWGKKDSVIPFKSHKNALSMLPNARLKGVDGAVHNVVYHKPDIVNTELLNFFNNE